MAVNKPASRIGSRIVEALLKLDSRVNLRLSMTDLLLHKYLAQSGADFRDASGFARPRREVAGTGRFHHE